MLLGSTGLQIGQQAQKMPTIFDCIKSLVPGPGAYDTPCSEATLPAGPAYTIGLRYPSVNDQTPGPGEYHIETADKELYHLSGCAVIGTRYDKHPAEEAPGPGAYQLHQPSELRPGAQTFGDRHPDLYIREREMTPDPAQYNVMQSLKQAQDKAIPCTFKSGSTPLGPFDDLAKTPGPLAYAVDDRATTPRSQVACIGRKQPINYDNHVPGPGFYQNVAETYIKLTQPASPAFTFHERYKYGGPFDTQAVKGLEFIAPGTYNVDKLITQGGLVQPHAAHFAGRYKDPVERERQLIPGPGTYFQDSDTLSSSQNNSKVSNQSKSSTGSQKSTQFQMTPRYSPSLTKGCKIGERSADSSLISSQSGLGTHDIATVGPGSYTPKIVTPRPVGGVMGMKHKDLNENLGDGPAKYNTGHAASVTLPALVKPHMHNGRANELESPFTTKFDCSCSGGPGTYSIGEKLVSKKIRSLRELMRSDSPRGPISGKINPPISSRYRERRVPDTPGPGAYDIAPVYRGPAFSLGSRTAIAIGSGASGI